MRLWTMLAVAAALGNASPALSGAQPAQSAFSYEKMMVPMRDGARLETVIIRPREARGQLPILLMRSPYGVPQAAPAVAPRGYDAMAADGYIFVY